MAPHQELVLTAAGRLRRHVARNRRWANVTLYTGIALVVVVVVAAAVGPFVAPYGATKQSLVDAFQGPSTEHLFGTDQFGRDIFSRVLHAIRVDLQLGLVATYVPLVVGMLLGALAGFYRGWFDGLVMRLVDVTIALPFIVLVLAIVAIVGPGLTGIYIGLMVVSWALYARLTRSEMLVLREQQFILAARTLGYSTPRILRRHALPSLLRANLVFSMADIVLNILALSALSFLGLGVQPPDPELGAIVADGQAFLLRAWWITTLPGLVIVFIGIAFSLLGDGLADRLGQRLELPK